MPETVREGSPWERMGRRDKGTKRITDKQMSSSQLEIMYLVTSLI